MIGDLMTELERGPLNYQCPCCQKDDSESILKSLNIELNEGSDSEGEIVVMEEDQVEPAVKPEMNPKDQ